MGIEIMDRTPPPADARVAYGGAEQQFAEIRLPPGSGPYAVAMLIHGGFWRPHRTLSHMSFLAAALACEGVASFNIEYRRVGEPGGGWPGTTDDVRAAALHLQRIAGEYRFDLDRTVAAGFSAGGQLALWLAAEKAIPLRGVVSLGGAVDLRHIFELDLGDGAVTQFLGGSPSEFPERYRAASPAERVPIGVPQRLLHGVDDDIVPVQIARRHYAAAIAVGDEARLIEIAGAGHFELIDPESHAWPAVRDAVLEVVPSALARSEPLHSG